MSQIDTSDQIPFETSMAEQTSTIEAMPHKDHKQLIDAFGLTGSLPPPTQQWIDRLDSKSLCAQLIRQYFDSSKAENDSLKIIDIWEVCHLERDFRFIKQGFDRVDNWLLWHGTARSNLVDILRNGFLTPSMNGQPSATGTQFADRVAKSAAFADTSGPLLLLLCQVSLGRK